MNSAPGQFQYAIQQTLQELDGVRNTADDIIVWGKSQREHDERLETLTNFNDLQLHFIKGFFQVFSLGPFFVQKIEFK